MKDWRTWRLGDLGKVEIGLLEFEALALVLASHLWGKREEPRRRPGEGEREKSLEPFQRHPALQSGPLHPSHHPSIVQP